MNIRHTLSGVLVSSLLTIGAVANPLQAAPTQYISQLIERLPCPPPATDSLWRCANVDRGFGLRLRRSGQEITHIGIRIFDTPLRQYNDPIICDCIERLLLELSIEEAKPNMGINAWMKQYDVHLRLDGYAYGRGSFTSLQPAFNIIRHSQSIQIKEEEFLYSLEVSSDNDHLLILTFPKDRSLIWATDKHEEDQHIAQIISQSQGHQLPQVTLQQSDNMAPYMQVYQRRGDAFLIDRLRATTYYKTKDAAAPALFDATYPELSLTNMMLLAAGHPDTQVELTHRVYGLNPIVSQKRWADLVTAIVTSNTQLYAAASKTAQGDKLSGVMIIDNPHYGYIDMLMISVSIEDLFHPTQPKLKATLYTNVPQNNVLNLFD